MPVPILGVRRTPTLRGLFYGFDPGAVSFARASAGWAFARGSLLSSCAINQPRFAYDYASGAYQGLLIEPQRTNGVRNSVVAGAVTGTPGTLPTNWLQSIGGGASSLTRTIVGSGVEYGMHFVDIRYIGTTATTGYVNIIVETFNQNAALQNEVWAASYFVRLVGGSLTNVSSIAPSIYEVSGGGTYLAGGSAAMTVNSSLRRGTYVRTLSNALTGYVATQLSMSVAVGAVDVTLRIYNPQIEKASGASQPIVTSGSKVTRAADVLSFTVPSGISTIRYTFDDNSTQDVAVSAGAYTVPTTLNKPTIKRITGL